MWHFWCNMKLIRKKIIVHCEIVGEIWSLLEKKSLWNCWCNMKLIRKKSLWNCWCNTKLIRNIHSEQCNAIKLCMMRILTELLPIYASSDAPDLISRSQHCQVGHTDSLLSLNVIQWVQTSSWLWCAWTRLCENDFDHYNCKKGNCGLHWREKTVACV